MGKMITMKLPKEDVAALVRVLEDIRFLEKSEKGEEEIDKGKFKTLDQLKKKYKIY
ncbi:MAG: hypothetical protein HYU56_01230 [Candidatus Aenigmarchaeota archaeon]|nr:hypothetical protein [Candidatus Aenigmarchaeota archaeon]